MNELTIIKQDGGSYVDSREVADAIGKPHNDLMKAIRKYNEYLTAGNFSLSDFFVEYAYFDSTGRKLPCYLLTKMGCEIVANKLTGKKGVMFTAAYVTRFNEMEAAERAEFEAKSSTPTLRVFNAAVRNVLSGFRYTYASVKRVYDFLNGAYEPFGILVAPNGEIDNNLSATDIARIIGIYSDNCLPHAHAVAAIIDRLDLAPEDIEIIPFGVIGISVRYSTCVLNAVKDWLEENNFPRDIPYLNFEYHIHYGRPLSFLDDDEVIDLTKNYC